MEEVIIRVPTGTYYQSGRSETGFWLILPPGTLYVLENNGNRIEMYYQTNWSVLTAPIRTITQPTSNQQLDKQSKQQFEQQFGRQSSREKKREWMERLINIDQVEQQFADTTGHSLYRPSITLLDYFLADAAVKIPSLLYPLFGVYSKHQRTPITSLTMQQGTMKQGTVRVSAGSDIPGEKELRDVIFSLSKQSSQLISQLYTVSNGSGIIVNSVNGKITERNVSNRSTVSRNSIGRDTSGKR